jgi:hypothetical protein
MRIESFECTEENEFYTPNNHDYVSLSPRKITSEFVDQISQKHADVRL